jgi:putative endonuclease
MTNDLPRRLAAHGSGRGGAYTRSRQPVRLVYTERRRSRGAALSREAAIKRLSRAAKLALVGRQR